MSWPPLGRIVLGLALSLGLGAPSVSAATDFTLYTQNMKRFGHGSANWLNGQCQHLNSGLNSANVLVMQEAMIWQQLRRYCPNINQNTWYSFSITPPNQNPKYIENYLFAYRNPNVNYPQVAPALANNAPQISNLTCNICARTPVFVLFYAQQSQFAQKQYFWLGDFHATWKGANGLKGVAARRAEAAAVGQIVSSLSAQYPVIVAGDWNLAGTATNFPWVPNQQASMVPSTTRTSLTRSANYSEPYDHVVTSKGVAIAPVQLMGAPCQCWVWYSGASDHLGVLVKVGL